jgi:HTH-type transcriptional regulator / antitoxin HigA
LDINLLRCVRSGNLIRRESSSTLGWEVLVKMKTVLANPAEMIAKGAPRVIHNDRELAAYAEALFQLTSLEDPSPAEAEAMELLTLLVDRYEQSRHSLPAADAISVLRFLIDHQGLTQRDLIPEFGSESADFYVPARPTKAHT